MRVSLSSTVAVPSHIRKPSLRQWLSQRWCAVWGHEVDNHRFRQPSQAAAGRRCPCGASYLAEDGSLTHVRHTLTCFFGHHTYSKLIERDGHREYVCVQCGHPLVFDAGHDPYGESAIFNKKVRYLCGIFGHRVHQVTDRDGFREFACHCGHTFLKPENDAQVQIKHPAICVVSGHRIRFVARRGGYAEYVCRDCGHPFCFADPESA
jgi:DNA-directed RNA polymerase subunit RPC12/RpoP